MSATKQAKAGSTNHVDVVIVGAGISGIGSAYHLQQQCPNKSYVVLEMKDTFGGTWETHKYPGVRSDSDLYTFGYRFKPWVGPPIASAEEMFLTSSTREVVPIARVNRNPIGNGKPGAVTLTLLKAYRQAVDRLIEED